MLSDAKYNQWIGDLGSTFRPQRQWAEGRGLFLIVGHFLSGIGAGTWLFSLWFRYRPGLLISLTAVGLGGLAHLFFLGRPDRFWKMFRLQSSWIARGFVGMNVFLLGAVIYGLPRMTSSASWRAAGVLDTGALALSLVGAVILIVYKGNVYAASKGVPFWDSPILPILYMAYALRGGVAMILASLPVSGVDADPEMAAIIELWIAVSAAVMVTFYLGVMRNGNVTARRSVLELTRGRLSGPFYLGTILVGLVIPIGAGLLSFLQPLSLTLLALVGVFSVIGDFFAKYTIVKSGVYSPVLPAGMTVPRLRRS